MTKTYGMLFELKIFIELHKNYTCRLLPGILFGAGLSHYCVLAKSLATENFMANPVTDVQTLEKSPDNMRTIMELMIMRIQVSLLVIV